jgi:hypothetical protein
MSDHVVCCTTGVVETVLAACRVVVRQLALGLGLVQRCVVGSLAATELLLAPEVAVSNNVFVD